MGMYRGRESDNWYFHDGKKYVALEVGKRGARTWNKWDIRVGGISELLTIPVPEDKVPDHIWAELAKWRLLNG